MTKPKPLDPDDFGKCFDCNDKAIHVKQVKAAVIYYHQGDVLLLRAYINEHITIEELDWLRNDNIKDSFRGVIGEGFNG